MEAIPGESTPGESAPAEPMVERRLAIPGSSLYYRLWPAPGSERVLLLAHGFASNSSRWQGFADATALRGQWNIIAPDLRGHGRSPWRGRLHCGHWVDDFARILDAEGFARAVIGGHCLGANTALRFAARQPQRTSGLVLIEPMVPAALGGRLGRLRRLRGVLPLLALPIRALNALGIRRRRLPVLDLGALDRETRAHMHDSGDTGALVKRYGSIRHDLHYMATAAYVQALGEIVRPLPPLQDISAPALVLLSTGDLFGDPAYTRGVMRTLPSVDIEELPAQHWIPTEQPEAMAAAIESWLGRHEPGPT